VATLLLTIPLKQALKSKTKAR